jgi:glycolate oxidase iron-sulfur subunit
MYDMKKLAQLMHQLENQLVVCMRCGMCQAVCPLFAETGRESDVARGKLALLDGLLQEMFKNPAGVNDRLSRCLLCGSCAANCPSGVKVLDIFIKARAILSGYMGLSPAKKVVFRGMLSRPELFDRLIEWGAKLQGFFVRPVDELLGTSCSRFTSPLSDRHFKALAPVPFHRMKPSLSTEGSSGTRAAFFVGCLIDKVFPNVGGAVLKSLGHHEIGVYLPENQGCCGIPALSSGDTETFNRLVRHNLQRFFREPFDHLITACATCTSVIKKIWPMMTEDFTEEERRQIKVISEKAVDISELLAKRATPLNPAAVPEEIERKVLTYHDPCHLKKSLGVASQPRALLRANPEYQLKEMLEADRCCGCGGSFNLQHYDISTSIGRRKRENIVASKCEVVATGCPACMLQLSDMLSQSGDQVQVRHTIEIYVEGIGGEG